MNAKAIYVLANDIVPGSSMPVAAPGLRASGLVDGLVANGLAAQLVTPTGNTPSPWRSPVPRPGSPRAIAVRPVDLRSFFSTRAPATVIITNFNYIEAVEGIDGLDIVFDLFAPKVLELRCGVPAPAAAAVARATERKIRALQSASGFLVNGRKKLPYLSSWLERAGVKAAPSRVAVAEMAVPASPLAPDTDGPLRLVMGGYVQKWSRPGAWLDVVAAHLPADAVVSIALNSHWGNRNRGRDVALGDLALHPGMNRVSSMAFEQFQELLSTHHVMLDLFEDTEERRLAMVTRTVVALASGVPVIHPPFTEVSPLIEKFDAGWLVDAGDSDAVAASVASVVADRAGVRAKAANAHKLWKAHFDPAVATKEAALLIRRLHDEADK